MNIVSIVNEKGGTGKTTAATNLAVCASMNDRKTLLLDADTQGSAAFWGRLRGDLEPTVAVRSLTDDYYGKKLREILPIFEKEGFDFIVIDAGGRLHEVAFAAVKAADFCIIPIMAGRADLESTKGFWTSVIEEIAELKTLKAALLINGWRGTIIQDLTVKHAQESLQYPVLESSFSMATAYQDAFARGLGVLELEKSTKPSGEVVSLYEEIVTAIASDTSGQEVPQ